MHRIFRTAVGALAVLGFALLGCGKSPDAANPAGGGATVSDGQHDGWWCNEHGVPEEVCTLCNSKLAAAYKAKGDWCKEHDVADSQCFVCHPERQAEFAAQYEAKYGKQPPKLEGADGEAAAPKPDTSS